MDPLTALGLACNVMQVISFAHETISLCKRLYRNGSSNPDLVYHASHLSILSSNLQVSINDAARQGSSLNQQRKELQAIANECYHASTALQVELEQVANPSVGSYRMAIRATLKTIWRQNSLDKLEKNMVAIQRLLETKLLGQLYIDVINTQRDVQALDKNLKYFIEQYAQGRRQISQLILDQGESVKAHITNETEKLRRDLDVQFDNLKLIDMNQDLVTRVLSSLKDTTTNLRRNQVAESYNGTFERIFDENLKRPWNGFVRWLASDSRLYWINGKPGSGKSTLMKFLVGETRTQDALNDWYPNCAIISAFLWKSGQEIQRSRKGLLSFLVYQLLSGQVMEAKNFISAHADIANKACLSDWSVAELERILFDLIRWPDDHVCIFIDGLDEFGPEDDVHDLINLVRMLKDEDKVKVCVSSRPERSFQLAFDACPKLKLQDLTASDIKHYIADFLEPQAHLLPSNNYPGYAISELTELITGKADGVFLWVHLVLRSVRTGITNGDDWRELLQRLRRLPGNLHELYSEMWQRLNEDEPFYRKEAAFYFYAVINSGDIPPRSPIVLAISLGVNPSIVSTILDSRSRIAPDQIVKMCHQTVNRIHLRSAGLLETRISILDDTCKQGTRDQLEKLLKTEISFIHRTARDFLLETESGKEIMKHDEIGFEAQTIRLLKALAAGAVTLHCPLTAGLYVPPVEGFLESLHNLQWPMSGIEEYQHWEDFVVLLQELFQHNALCTNSQFDFLGLAASYGFAIFVAKSLVKMKEKAMVPPEYMNYLLRCASSWEPNHAVRSNYDRRSIAMIRWHAMLRAKILVKWLLEVGADPNAHFRLEGEFLWECTTFTTFIGRISDELMYATEDTQRRKVAYDWFVSNAKIFIEAGANLNSVGYIFYGEVFDHEVLLDEHLDEHLAELTPVFLSEANAAYLIQHILETFHNIDPELDDALDNSKFSEAKSSNRITLAGWAMLDFEDELKEQYKVPYLKFNNLVAVTEEDSVLLTDLFRRNWRKHESGRNPFEPSDLKGILQRGRQVDFIEYMEQSGVFLLRTTEKEDYPPRLPGETLTKRYTTREIRSKRYPRDEFPSHTWFQD
ncbi:MAG: hypothetical protein M1821_002751 [Bathelium mastoideum]|nr:MAG: hypothetical protein M1821_002751 [Bathelium mastoideum]